jgi:hypothetical protein
MPRSPKNPRPMSVASLLRHITAIVLFVVAAGCSGGGCSSGCASCGLTPLASGFDPTKRIENAGSARVTPSGLAFIQSNLGALAGGLLGSAGGTGGIINFAVPATSTSFSGITASICPNGANTTSNPQICNAQINIGQANLTMTPTSPYDLSITGTVPLLVQDIPVTIDLGICSPTINIAMNGNGAQWPVRPRLRFAVAAQRRRGPRGAARGAGRARARRLRPEADRLRRPGGPLGLARRATQRPVGARSYSHSYSLLPIPYPYPHPHSLFPTLYSLFLCLKA